MTATASRAGDLPEVVHRAMDRATGSRAIPGNQVTLLFDGPEIFPAMLTRIAAAERWVHLDSYIFRADDTGRRFLEALVERAHAGVAVRVLTDWIGSFMTMPRFWRGLRAAGGIVRNFNPPRLIQLRGNFIRNHRKLLVVDGRTAVVGGHCIGNEWAGTPARKRKPWRETACTLDGPAAVAVDRAFARLWAQTGEPLPDAELAADVPEQGDSAVRVMAGEPGGVRASRATELLLDGAEQRIWVTDAYFIAPRGIYQALSDAARDGVDVRLLVPGTSDLTHVQNLTRIGYRDLLRAGVRIFEWRGPMLHAKTIVTDSRWVRIGSTNLNLSSLLANYELDVLMDDLRLGLAMEAQFRRDLEQSVEIRLRAPRKLAAVPGGGEAGDPPKTEPARRRHRPGLRERRRRAVVALWAVVAGARRAILLQYSIALAALGILFLIFPRIMAIIFAGLALWLALSAWLESWGKGSGKGAEPG
ncbi:MAG: phospholipase D-like domain-containing protein [Gemmatimonadales bacterium]